MGQEHAPDTVFEAEDLYCVDRLSMRQVAERTGVAESTLWRWSKRYGWAAKREEVRKLQAEIRQDTVKLRASLIKNCLQTKDPMDAFAVAKMEALVLQAEELAAKQRQAAAPARLDLHSAAPGEVAECLEQAIIMRLSQLLGDPARLDYRLVADLRKALELVGEMRQGSEQEQAQRPGQGLTRQTEQAILQLLGVPGA
jgi:hypothetical protein